MPTYKLLTGTQRNSEFYVAVLDPRELIRYIDIKPPMTPQDAQRPWNEARVRSIAKYVAGLDKLSEEADGNKYAKGLIPNSPTLAVSTQQWPNLICKQGNEYLLCLPEEEKQIEEFKEKNIIKIVDGQHRLIAFHEEYLNPDFKESIKFELSVILLPNLSTDEKREVFIVTNERQNKVESNVLREIKKWLGILTKEDDKVFELLNKMNQEDISPLKGRIIVGGAFVRNGYKLVQLSKILRINSKTYDSIKHLELDQQVRSLSYYLSAWERVFNGVFNNSKTVLGKIAGMRFIITMFPDVFDIIKQKDELWDIDNIVKVIQEFSDANQKEEYFKTNKNHFAGESSTVELAKQAGTELKSRILNNRQTSSPFRNL